MTADNDERMINLMKEAQEALQVESPIRAFEIVCQMIRETQGEGAIIPLIDQAKASWSSKEAEEKKLKEKEKESKSKKGASILGEQGRLDIIHDALQDGSTSLCPYCHGFISARRLDSHLSFWCPGLNLPHDSPASSSDHL